MESHSDKPFQGRCRGMDGAGPNGPSEIGGSQEQGVVKKVLSFLGFEVVETSIDPGTTSALDHVKPEPGEPQGLGMAGLTEQQRKNLPPGSVIR